MKYLKKFFQKDGEFSPIRLVITVFVILCVIAFIIKLCMNKYLSDTFMASLFTFILGLIGADTWRANVKTKNGKGKKK